MKVIHKLFIDFVESYFFLQNLNDSFIDLSLNIKCLTLTAHSQENSYHFVSKVYLPTMFNKKLVQQGINTRRTLLNKKKIERKLFFTYSYTYRYVLGSIAIFACTLWHFLWCIRDAAHQFVQLYKSLQHFASACYIPIILSDKMKNYAIVPSCERDNKAAAVPDKQPIPGATLYTRLLRPPFH